MEYSIRKATFNDCSDIDKLIALSARELSAQDYTPEQIEGALQGAFGVDTQLIKDETYFVVEAEGNIVGCGGWSKRKTLFGSDKEGSRDPAELNPETDSAKIRAFFVHPNWVRKGIGTAILARCEQEAAAFGFHSLELMATLPGIKLYSACGFTGSERVHYILPSGITIEFLPMKKVLTGK
ncbi:MAG: GNAT family N-acetyltransferase [Ignavibacteriales bacterium]|nr:GNAT family N-acetyltransferase [Ignavibacteriales bacterium]